MATRNDPFTNFRFMVQIGNAQAGFSSVAFTEGRIEGIDYREGQDLKAGVRRLPGRIKHGSIILKRGMTGSLELVNWWKQATQGKVQRKDIKIVILNDEGKPSATLKVSQAWPVAYSQSPLVAKGNDVAVESLELAHEGIDREP